MIYGYARISRKQQSIERQIRNIKTEYPDAYIVKEAFTGRQMDRPEWLKLYAIIKEGDIIVFDSVSRMSRSAEEGTQIYFELYNRGIQLVFLKEPYINTETYKSATSQAIKKTGNTIADIYIAATNEVIKILAEEQIKKAFEQSEKEVEDLRQRTREGMVTAKLNGKTVGRRTGTKIVTQKEKKAKKIILKYNKDFEGLLKDTETIKLAEVSRKTYYKYKKELLENAMEL